MGRPLAILAWLPATALAGPVELVYAPGPLELVHGPVQYDTIPSAEETLLDAPLTDNGLTAADPSSTWSVTVVTAPDGAWWGDDEVGSGSATTYTPVLTGTDADQDTPFCPDGSHDDLTSGCMTAQRLGGSNDYYLSTANPGPASPASADFTVCALYRSAANGVLVSQTEGANCAGEGWYIYHSGGSTGKTILKMENDAGTDRSVDANVMDNHGWSFSCLTHDYDGNTVAYGNGSADESGASPGGTIAPAVKLSIGACPDGSQDFTGDIAFVLWWNSLLDATDMAELYEHFVGILDSKGAPVAFTSTGPNCCWIDSQIECFNDNWPMIGCELPPGVTGAGSPSSRFYSGEALTNSVAYSRDLDSWTDEGGGGPTPTPASTDLFRDGRTTYSIQDNDAGAKERSKSANIDISGLDASDKIQMCVYAKSGGTELLDIRFKESTGGACAASTTDQDAFTTSTSWQQKGWTHTVQDGDCEIGLVEIAAADFGDAANTGGPTEAVVQVFLDQDWCPPIYIETAAAAVGAGDDLLAYDISGVSQLTTVGDGTTLTVDFAPPFAALFTGYLAEIEDTATAVDYYRYYVSTDEKIYLSGRSTAEGAARAMYTETAAGTWTPGTAYEIKLVINGAATTVAVDGVDNPGANVTLTSAPDSIDALNVGVRGGGTAQLNGWLSNVQVTK